MKYHRQFPALDLWTDGDLLRGLVAPETLIAARLEPIMHRRLGAAVLDLVFGDGERWAIVPAVRVDAGMLLEHEDSPLIWPHAISATLADSATDRVADFLLPWLHARVRARGLTTETVRVFDDSQRAAFESARAAGWLGAAPYARLAHVLAPYWYAARFAGRRGVLAAPAAHLGRALLSRWAEHVAIAPSQANDGLAGRWFGAPSPESELRGPFDFAVVDAAGRAELGALLDGVPAIVDLETHADWLTIGLASPVPTDLLVAFDLAEAPAVRSFAVQSVERELRPAGIPAFAAGGGSAGRIFIGLRADAASAPDGDTDEGYALAAQLRAEGLQVEVGTQLPGQRAAEFDLVHLVGLGEIEGIAEMAAAAHQAGVPIALTAHFEDLGDRRWAGSMMAPVVYHSRDEIELQSRLEKLERRELETAEYFTARRCAPLPDYDQRVAAVLAQAAVVFVSCASEGALLRERFGLAAQALVVGPHLAPGVDPSPVCAEAGTADFIFCHAPILNRTNVMALARAARQARLPLVVAGPVADPHHLERAREYGDERLILLPDPSPGALAALYRRARVYADLAWYSYGTSRRTRAALSGAAVVVSGLGYASEHLGAAAWIADPASERAIAGKLREAWTSAERGAPGEAGAQTLAAWADPAANFRAVVRAYAEAAGKQAASR